MTQEQRDEQSIALQAVMKMLTELMPGYGIALFIFEFNKPGMANYISNAQRDTMLAALKETYHRISKGEDIRVAGPATPGSN